MSTYEPVEPEPIKNLRAARDKFARTGDDVDLLALVHAADGVVKAYDEEVVRQTQMVHHAAMNPGLTPEALDALTNKPTDTTACSNVTPLPTPDQTQAALDLLGPHHPLRNGHPCIRYVRADDGGRMVALHLRLTEEHGPGSLPLAYAVCLQRIANEQKSRDGGVLTGATIYITVAGRSFSVGGTVFRYGSER